MVIGSVSSVSVWRRVSSPLALLAVLWSCAAPEAVSSFSASAQQALSGGPALFSDIHESCLRRQALRPSAPLFPAFVPPGSKDAPPAGVPGAAVCARFAPQGQGLTKVSGVLADYFKAMQKLAGFQVSGVTAANEAGAENAASAAGLDYTQVVSIGKLANLVTRLVTEGYQRSQLLTGLTDADPEIQTITTGLDTVAKLYIDSLNEEQQTITAEYQTAGGTKDRGMLLLLNRAYSEDLEQVTQKRAAATAYRDALRNIRDGHHTLARDAHYMNAKELMKALQPYTSNLNGLIPSISKKT